MLDCLKYLIYYNVENVQKCMWIQCVHNAKNMLEVFTLTEFNRTNGCEWVQCTRIYMHIKSVQTFHVLYMYLMKSCEINASSWNRDVMYMWFTKLYYIDYMHTCDIQKYSLYMILSQMYIEIHCTCNM